VQGRFNCPAISQSGAESLTVIPRGTNLYPGFVACALDRQEAYPLRPGINYFLTTDTLLRIALRVK
jgi:hypothetical protein